MRRRRRHLTEEERELWQKVQATATALHPAKPQPLPRPAPAAVQVSKAEPAAPVASGLPQDFVKPIGKGSVSLNLRPDLAAQPRVMDKKTYTKMKRGKVVPEARIDLHGLRQDEAHADLTAFLLASHQLGRRLVLVITGKGAGERPRDGERGILRHAVPQWMSLSPLKQVILQVTGAHISHGGTGAFYVYLRRDRG